MTISVGRAFSRIAIPVFILGIAILSVAYAPLLMSLLGVTPVQPVVAGTVVRMKPGWLPIANEESLLASLFLNSTKQPQIVFVKVRPPYPGISRSISITAIDKRDPTAVPGVKQIAQYSWGKAFLFSPASSQGTGRKAVVLDRFGLLAAVEDVSDVEEIVDIRPDTTRR